MHSLIELMRDRIAGGLKRNTLRSPSKWACEYRVMGNPYPGKWTFIHHPWLKPMHDSTATFNIGMKAAQVGFTEWALNKTFYNIDILANDCLYILPGEGDAGDFSAGRFDPALEQSPHLRNLFSAVRNVGHKRAWSVNLYIRGSRSRSKLKSIPTPFIAFDEVDEMTQANIPLALERASGQLEREVLMLSTPTIEKDDYGIFGYYATSSQEHFFFPCPHCGRLIELTPEDNLEVGDPISKSFYFCNLCKGVLQHTEKPSYLDKGIFVPSVSNADPEVRGFTVSQLYSSAYAGKPEEIASAIVQAETDPAKEQELHNSKFGRPHTVAGARLSESDLDRVIKADVAAGPIITMGVDVGTVIYVDVSAFKVTSRGNDINDTTIRRSILRTKVREFDELDPFMRKYGVHFCVVDRHPETRLAFQFAMRFWGRVLLCMYGNGLTGRQVSIGPEAEKTVTVDRTSWLDCFFNRIRNNTLTAAALSDEYRLHLKNLVRHYDTDRYGNPIVRYINIGPDHYAHASTYAEIALLFAKGVGHENITKVT